MFRLLALVATTLAAPQYPYGVPAYYYPQYTGYPFGVYGGVYNPVQRIYPAAYYPTVPVVQATAPVTPQGADTRQLIKFQNFQEINANFVEQTDATTMAATPTTTASQVIVGTVNIQQNLVTDFLNGNEAQYKINVRTTGTLDLTGQNIMVGIASDCITPASGTGVVATINVPPTLNGFYVAGRTTGFNIDGMNSMTSLRGMRMQILNAAGDMIIGCTSDAALN